MGRILPEEDSDYGKMTTQRMPRNSSLLQRGTTIWKHRLESAQDDLLVISQTKSSEVMHKFTQLLI